MIRHKSKNWLLLLGIITALLFVLLYNFVGSEHPYKGSRNYSDVPLKVMLFLTLLFAPLFEEIAFRGFFTGKKWIKIAAIIFLPIFVLTVNASMEWFVIVLSMLFIAAYLLSLKYENKILGNISILLNILLFTAIHYTLEDFYSPDYFFTPLAQLSIGCFLIWITINFNLLKAMLFHFLWNAGIMLFLIYSLQFPDTETKIFSNETFQIEWVKVPVFNNENAQVNISEGFIEGTNIEARKFHFIVSTIKTKDKIMQYEPYVIYNFSVQSLDTLTSLEDLKEETLKFLENQELVFKKEKEI
ncbi:type II CAAX prenyl endopeptidase Rce1 family protein [Gillisia sp. Q332]|uniref:CPBP family glutamic-type intramembrane protease n=1 Tax=Gillisia xinjiangensis TaxID=3384765 RepID=UPI00391B1717